MKKSFLAVLLAVCLIFASVGFAADQSENSNAQDLSTRGAQSRADNIIKADDLAGKIVQDMNGNELGKVDSIALDTAAGNAYALISLDNKLHPVPISALKKAGDKYSLNVDKNRLAQSPSFTEDSMRQQMASRDFDARVYRFFGITPPWGSSRK